MKFRYVRLPPENSECYSRTLKYLEEPYTQKGEQLDGIYIHGVFMALIE